MGFSAFLHSPLSLPPLPPPRKLQLHGKAEQFISASLPAPRPRFRRKNHLRPKLHNPQPPCSPAPPPPAEPIESSSFVSASGLLIAGGVDPAEESFVTSEAVDAFLPSAVHPGSVLGLAGRFAALLAIQTAVAVWFLGREEVQEGRVERRDWYDSGLLCKGREKTDWKDNRQAAEFEMMVLQIREMARGARQREASGIQKGYGVKENVGKGIVGQKKRINKELMDEQAEVFISKNNTGKLKFSKDVVYLPKVKGFKGSKRVNGGTGLSKGGMQHIAPKNSRESAMLHEPGKSDAQSSGLTQKDIEEFSAVDSAEKLPDFNRLHISPQRKHPKRDSFTSLNNNSIKADTVDSEKAISCRQSNICESLVERNIYSMGLTDTNGRPHGTLQNKETNSIPVVDRDKKSFSGSQAKEVRKWWQSLPYVFVILLHRGSGENGDKGLYSLKLTSTPQKGNQPSCTIAFQDRGDATNFSFLLESFFEDLGDVSADVVPLTIHELDDAELNLTVVKKGQLCLYAGQPLAEVETALSSILE